MRKPRDLVRDGCSWVFCGLSLHDPRRRVVVFGYQHIYSPAQARRASAWLLKAADWLEGEKK